MSQLLPMNKPMALLSDIHGNLPALEEVLRWLTDREVTSLFVAGDILLGGDQPLEVWRRLRQAQAHCVRGLSDNALVSIDTRNLEAIGEEQKAKLERFIRTRAMIGDLVLKEVRSLPQTLRVPLIDGSEVVITHGAPTDPNAEISDDLRDEEMLALIGDDPADVVVCGATHVPFQRTIEGVHVINVGSVGAAPEGRFAHFTTLMPRMDGAQIEQHVVEY